MVTFRLPGDKNKHNSPNSKCKLLVKDKDLCQLYFTSERTRVLKTQAGYFIPFNLAVPPYRKWWAPINSHQPRMHEEWKSPARPCRVTDHWSQLSKGDPMSHTHPTFTLHVWQPPISFLWDWFVHQYLWPGQLLLLSTSFQKWGPHYSSSTKQVSTYRIRLASNFSSAALHIKR